MKHSPLNFLAALLAAMLWAAAGQAQRHLPPVFGADSVLVRHDPMDRAFVTPSRVVWTQGDVQDARLLLVPGSGQSDIFSSGMCRLTSSPDQPASLILDFGRELHGGLKLVVSSCSPLQTPQVRLRFGESLTETCSELTPQAAVNPGQSLEEPPLANATATNDHAVRDLHLTLPFYGQMEIGNTGFRFVRIDLLSPSQTVHLKEVSATLRFRDVEWVGQFKCSDERLNRIWETGAYTVQLNMQEYIWDGIKRDRLIWVGDMHPETSTISTVFGDQESFYASMDLACRQWPLPQWLNGMSAYSMWYLIIQHDWYRHFGNLDFLQKHRDYILGLIDLIDSKVDEEGYETLSPSRFLDWPSSPNREGVEAGYRALLVWALRDARVLCLELDAPDHAQKCSDIEARLRRRILPPNGLKQAAALMAIADLMPAEEACAQYISVGGPRGFSTFYGFYMLQALAKAGRYEEAMDIISRYWGGMLDMGATTFWEDFDLDWTTQAARIDEFTPPGKKDLHGDFGDYCYPGFRHSFCHGWASGPTTWLSTHVLGIEILEPGCRKVRITPHLGKLQWAEGSYPTPYGPIRVRHEVQPDGKVKSRIQAPRGVKVVR